MAFLQVSHIEKRFGRVEVLRDISFTLDQGQSLAIIGSSGSGKTTLLRCLNFLERPDGGRITVRDEFLFDAADPAVQSEGQIRRKRLHFGLVFQSFHLFPQYTALENVMLAGSLLARERPDYKANKQAILARIREEAAGLLTQVGLQNRLDSYPHQLSGGQQQRVAIARALAAGSEIILADEPTGNLDTENTENIVSILGALAREAGRCVIIVTHDPAVSAAADVVLHMRDGKLAAEGG